MSDEKFYAELEDGTVMADPSVVPEEGHVGVTDEQLNPEPEADTAVIREEIGGVVRETRVR